MDVVCRPELRRDPGVVQVVAFTLDDPVPGALEILDAEERARAARFVFDRDRARFIAAHAYLRLLLARYAGHPPAALRFTATTSGKPRLLEPPADVRFNLSHSGVRGLVALSVGIEVGVDIEAERPLALLDVARRFFAPGEVAALQALPAAERARAFFCGWTRKEAFIKAHGDGLGFPLDQFEVSLAPDEAGQLLRSIAADPDATAHWRVASVAAPPGYAAAVAAEGTEWHIVESHVSLGCRDQPLQECDRFPPHSDGAT
jgi:4'-phosphopantetheinyl transferase